MLTPLCALMSLMVSAQPEMPLRLSLHQQFGKAVFRECRLDISANNAYVRCLWSMVPPKELLRQRRLTVEEVNRLAALVRESNLLAGGHIGMDTTGNDGPPFETLRVTAGTATGILVTSENATFTTGPRRTLLDLLHTLLRELQDRPR